MAGWVLATNAPTPGQDGSGEDPDHGRVWGICAAIESWTKDFYRRAIQLDHAVELVDETGVAYVDIGRTYRLFGRRRDRKHTHFTALQTLIAAAEKHPGDRVASALLPLAASGYDHDLLRREMALVRDAGHSAILRMDTPAVWQLVQKVAANPRTEDVVLRLAALRLLGMKRQAALRAPVEKALAATQARVRLAAAEALGQIRDAGSLPGLVKAMEHERHPIVALAVIDAADRTLQSRRDKLVEADWGPFVDASLRSLGRAGWRNDLATVRLVRRYPRRTAVPILISLLRAKARSKTEDPMLKLVNRDASPVLAHEAWVTLRRLTGALLPRDPGRWTAFWEKEKDRVVMAPPIDDAKARAATRAEGGFFGIPVQGRDVIFVIDTSHSMRDAVEREAADGKAARTVQRILRSRRGAKGRRWTRLDAAKEQVLIAVAEMSSASHYRIVTFSDDVQAWHADPVPARRHSLRSLMKTFDQTRPAGFTNTFAALAHILDTAGAKLGAKPTGKPEDRVDEVFFLSDGEPSVGEIQDVPKILARVREWNRYRQVRINTVFTGTGEGAAFMRELAAQNHGIFVHYGQ